MAKKYPCANAALLVVKLVRWLLGQCDTVNSLHLKTFPPVTTLDAYISKTASLTCMKFCIHCIQELIVQASVLLQYCFVSFLHTGAAGVKQCFAHVQHETSRDFKTTWYTERPIDQLVKKHKTFGKFMAYEARNVFQFWGKARFGETSMTFGFFGREWFLSKCKCFYFIWG